MSTTSETKTPKRKKILPLKRKRFADVWLNNGGNGVKAAEVAYGSDRTELSLRVEASRLLSNDNVLEYIKGVAGIAAENVFDLANSAKNEAVKLSANRDILDRAGFRAVEEKRVAVLHASIGSKRVEDIAKKVSAELATKRLIETEDVQ